MTLRHPSGLKAVWLWCISVVAMAGVANIAFGSRRTTVERCGYETLGLDCERIVRLAKKNVRIVSAVLGSACDILLEQNLKKSTLDFSAFIAR